MLDVTIFILIMTMTTYLVNRATKKDPKAISNSNNGLNKVKNANNGAINYGFTYQCISKTSKQIK